MDKEKVRLMVATTIDSLKKTPDIPYISDLLRQRTTNTLSMITKGTLGRVPATNELRSILTEIQKQHAEIVQSRPVINLDEAPPENTKALVLLLEDIIEEINPDQ